MNQDEMIRRLVATGRVTRINCAAFLAAAAECGLEVVPRRPGSAQAASPVVPKRPISPGRVVAGVPTKRRVEVVPAAGRAARLLPNEPEHGEP